MPLLAGLGAGCILAALIFGIVYLGGWGPFSRTRKGTAQVAETTPSPIATPRVVPSAEPAPAPPVIEERGEESQPAPSVPAPTPAPAVRAPEPKPTPAPVQIVPPRVETPAPVTADEARLAPPPVPSPTPAPVPTVVAPIRTPAPAAPMPAASAGGLEDGKSYVNEVPVPGGGVVKLNGIAYSPDHPIAVLDGRVVAPGETVQGFTVVEIQANQVKLQGHGATVFVTTK
jgi:hypothetical protein